MTGTRSLLSLAALVGLALSGLCWTAVAVAAEGDDDAPDDANEYRTCVDLSARTPQKAHEVASDWLVKGGGIPAQHCVALSLAGLGRYAEAARTLEAAAEELRIAKMNGTYTGFFRRGEGLIGELLGQAGNAWLLAGDPMQAYTALSNGLTELEPGSRKALELIIDRARASGVAGDYAAALEDLEKAAGQAPGRVEIFVLRASAYRNMDRPDEAAADLTRAFDLVPADREALLERGNLRLMTGDLAGAGTDWRLIIALYPQSPAALSAGRNLDRLEAEEEASREGD